MDRGLAFADPNKPNGLRIRGLSGDVDRVSVQSSEQSSHLLTGRRWRFLPMKWTEVTLRRDEMMALCCNHGEALVELKNMGGPHGEILFNDAGRRVVIAEGSSEKLHLKPDTAVMVHCRNLHYPNR